MNSFRIGDPDLGKIWTEVDCFFAGVHRRPDASYFTKAQIAAIQQGEQTPRFVIEVISTNDQQNKAKLKLRNYRTAEVPVLWHIFPKLKEVDVYRGKNMVICSGDDLCSAEPVIPGFVLPPKDIFS